MKKGLIVFKGKYGSTRQYAQWLSLQLDIPYLEASQVTAQVLAAYDFIILGSPVYYGRLLLGSFIMKHLGVLKAKKVFVMIVCATPDSDQKMQKRIVKDNLPEVIADLSNIFFMAGRLVISKIGLADRLMLRLAAFFEKDPAKKQVMQNGIDGVSEDNLIDLVVAVAMYRLPKDGSARAAKNSSISPGSTGYP